MSTPQPKLGYSGLVAPLTFTSTPGMSCNRRMFESVVVGYDTYVQTEEVFEQHRPIVAGDELHIDVELTSVRRIAGRDLITVTNTFTDAAGERVHTLHTTVVGVTSEDINPAVKAAVQTNDDARHGHHERRRGQPTRRPCAPRARSGSPTTRPARPERRTSMT